MGHGHPGLGHQLTHAGCDLIDVVDPVVHEEHLAVPQHLAADGLRDGPLVVPAHIGQDRLPVGRRGVQEAEVPDAGQGHLKRARNRRGGQREHVYVGPESLDGLLVADPEMLFLVDHEEPQVLEADVLGQQPVGADDDVDRSVGQPADDPAGLSGRQEPAQHLDSHGEGRVPVPERLAVLLCEKRGRYQDRHLAAVLHGLERSPDRDLGLPEADISADEAVHRHGTLHVGLHVLDGLQLVGCLLEGEGLLQLALPRRVLGEHVARRGDACLVEEDKFLGDLGSGRPDPGLGLLPVGAAHPAECRRLPALVGSDDVDLVGRQVQPVVAPVLKQQVVALHAAEGAGHQPGEPGHTVLFVDHVVAGSQVLEHPHRGRAPRSGAPTGSPATGNLGLGDDR